MQFQSDRKFDEFLSLKTAEALKTLLDTAVLIIVFKYWKVIMIFKKIKRGNKAYTTLKMMCVYKTD